MKKRKTIGIPLVTGFFLLIAWGMIEPYLLDVEEETAEIDHLPPDWEGRTIITVGDFQVGMWLDNASNLEDMVEKIIAKDPDMVLLLGDYVYHSVESHKEEMEKVISYLKPLAETDIPIFALLGNHDYSMSEKDANPNMETAERVTRMLNSIGITVLKNESVPVKLEETDKPLYLVGIGALWPGNDHPEEAYEEIGENAPRFTFMHNPNTFEKIDAYQAPVAVAGHTHGGQIRIPFTPHWSWKDLIMEGEAHVDGWIVDRYGAEGNDLYVNRGIGVSVAPIRINNFPEITEFTLTEGE